LLKTLLWFTVNIRFQAWFVAENIYGVHALFAAGLIENYFSEFKFVMYGLRSTLTQLRPSNFILWNTRKLLFCAERICALRSTLSNLRQTLGAVALYALRCAPSYYEIHLRSCIYQQLMFQLLFWIVN
jgi:hypothetical protein